MKIFAYGNDIHIKKTVFDMSINNCEVKMWGIEIVIYSWFE